MDSNSPIGVFDSGLGGLTVLKELRRLLPHENFIFVGDSARAPYGSRTPEEIISFLQQFMDYFQSRGVKMAVCACNTMTSYGYPVIKDKTSFALVPKASCCMVEVINGGAGTFFRLPLLMEDTV